jgi:uncharacterized protein YgiM (DUF1202 family)
MKRVLYLMLLPLVLACSLTTPLTTRNQAGAMLPAREPTETSRTQPVQLQAAPSPTPATCTVTAEVLHLRACAGFHCAVTDWLEQGDILTLLATSTDWYQVQTPAGETGWVHSKYCGGQP